MIWQIINSLYLNYFYPHWYSKPLYLCMVVVDRLNSLHHVYSVHQQLPNRMGVDRLPLLFLYRFWNTRKKIVNTTLLKQELSHLYGIKSGFETSAFSGTKEKFLLSLGRRTPRLLNAISSNPKWLERVCG